MIIREAVAEDAAALLALMALLGHETTDEHVRKRLALTGEPTLVAVTDGIIVGMIGLSISTPIHRNAPVGRIPILVVAEHARNSGVGGKLLDAAATHLAARGCGMIEVTSNLRLTQAHAFYEKNSFERSSLRFVRAI